ncbi:ATP-binding response regulator [Celerinatantimonas diazotrophica]|nr:hybrid sensor histidine kinase/response regulator [Celerinatantimonas diazotrophica]
MVSTSIFHIIIPLAFNVFKYTWLPPALSVIELVFMGYAIICHRFYSWRYILFLMINSSIILSVFVIPILFIKKYIFYEPNIVISLIWALIFGLSWRTIWRYTGKYISLIIYGREKTPVSEINTLTHDFQISLSQATKKLSKLLQIDSNYISISDANTYQLYSSYLTKNDSALLKEEVEYYAENTQDFSLKMICEQMSQHDSAMVLPLYDNDHILTRLFITPHKKNGSVYSTEEVSALQHLLKNVESYIYSEYHIKKSQAIAHSIAHEMRNPLAKIQIHLEKIIQLTTSEDKYVDKITSEIEYAKKAIYNGNQIIDTILQEVHQPSIDPNLVKPYSIRQLTKQSILNYPFESDSIAERVLINESNDFSINVHKVLFEFIIFNLLRNAIYYFHEYPNSYIEIYFESTDNYYCQLNFKDYGPGINSVTKKRIFDDFFTFEKRGGTGLGLGYCQKVMKLFKGYIECHSNYGMYTLFTLYFPKSSIPLSRLTQYADINKEKKPNIFGTHIMVVDDNKSQRLLIILYLKKMGVKIIEAQNGQEALEKIHQHKLDIIFMDIQMPLLNGFDASHKIKEIYPKLPIIALSGESDKDEIQKINNIMDDRLEKPVRKNDLIKIIDKWLNH